ncbi:MAG TPA: hypothetical protein VGL28_07305 [Steroidobacteraceae bacterium]|jgi:hypothetical protein
MIYRATVLMSCLLSGGMAIAQTPSDLEPGVQTSPEPPPAEAPPPPAAAPAPVAAPQAAQPTAKGRTAKPAAAPPQPAAPAPGKSQDRIELGTTQISGNRELPKVMYVVPWRRADPGDFAGRPPNSLLDEALTPVDRDVFRRQNRYYSALEGGAGGPGAAASQSAAGGATANPPETRDEK